MINKVIQTASMLAANYYKPTPKKWRKVGDIILGAGTVVTAVGAIVKNPYIAVISVTLTWIGKTITNLATE